MNDSPLREIACTGLFLAMPCYGGQIGQPTHDSYVTTIEWLIRNGVPYARGDAPGDSLVTRARNSLVAAFMATSCSHLLFIDADISWEAQAVTRLLAVDKEMVCGVYVKKQLPPQFVYNIEPGPDGRCVTDGEAGLIEITGAPTGFLMLKRSVIEKMIAAHPQLKYREGKSVPEDRQAFTYALFDCELRDGLYWGEDLTFSNRWRAIGGRIWLDPTIHLKHHGPFAYEGDLGAVFRTERS